MSSTPSVLADVPLFPLHTVLFPDGLLPLTGVAGAVDALATLLEKARKAYEKALALDPNNAQIRQNYDLFKEINDRAVQAKDK